MKKTVIKILQISQKNTCFGVSFLIKLQALRPVTLLKRDSNTIIFLWNLRNFQEHLFWRTTISENLTSESSFCVTCNNNSRRNFYSTTSTLIEEKIQVFIFNLRQKDTSSRSNIFFGWSFCSINKFHQWNEGTTQTWKSPSSYKDVLSTLQRKVKSIQHDKTVVRNNLQENRQLTLLLFLLVNFKYVQFNI